MAAAFSLIQTWDNGICLGQDTELAVPDLHVSPVLTSLYMEPLVPLLPQQHLVQKVLQESKVFPDQIHTPDVMPTKRHINLSVLVPPCLMTLRILNRDTNPARRNIMPATESPSTELSASTAMDFMLGMSQAAKWKYWE
ncbi:hypothetical protein F7725_028699 [Dissostichus mawsoni]|uniref:Uncharacterized protein n=1 Tax=Dissostichus mawsoni TaxID=36200 RepID=A0A7J5XGS8_DISMA|nr:hypothetical protein F7725_028699 [Dissostichus mawsoni]